MVQSATTLTALGPSGLVVALLCRRDRKLLEKDSFVRAAWIDPTMAIQRRGRRGLER